ncbi:hypothetical protein [Streptomyces phaeochromogenes]
MTMKLLTRMIARISVARAGAAGAAGARTAMGGVDPPWRRRWSRRT